MKALLIIAHGSRLQVSNEEVVALKDSLESILDGRFSMLKVAFLELCEPSISQAIGELVSSDASEITVMPYFLNQGRHVREDVPRELQAMRDRFPEITINSLPYFGRSELIPRLLKQIIERHA